MIQYQKDVVPTWVYRGVIFALLAICGYFSKNYFDTLSEGQIRIENKMQQHDFLLHDLNVKQDNNIIVNNQILERLDRMEFHTAKADLDEINKHKVTANYFR